jgi:hypothetical protein
MLENFVLLDENILNNIPKKVKKIIYLKLGCCFFPTSRSGIAFYEYR